MKPLIATCFAGLLLAAPVAIAHTDVKNPAVMARMEAMKQIGGAMRTVADMVRGKTPFDAAAAAEAQATLAQTASTVVPLFEAPETDPKSEALPVIWENFDDFTAKAEALVSGAEGLQVTSLDSLSASFGPMAGSCGGCHKVYRE